MDIEQVRTYINDLCKQATPLISSDQPMLNSVCIGHEVTVTLKAVKLGGEEGKEILLTDLHEVAKEVGGYLYAKDEFVYLILIGADHDTTSPVPNQPTT